ncbi:glycoside hydrolase family 5 protein [Phanerochaete carnosa HHB-10118-sp]|uniref:Glycoside hydrolase family 5 protein n=1 Tax=Phanerochaete carnosa (strain HHB-10118-sp) TaxID=650164 RepID=K5VXK7_PHACS|nr:glycoside hydrolase family 5 protein [Phanerochaete carnosa HHB-10118-sp]EKM51309.1 glycoside hydrolase family 5 protein [Phanerochaete carnosa HHB-10118-sp]
MAYLQVSGTKIVDKDGKEVILRGAGLGGWMNMENFISGYPGCEYQIRAALADVVGQDKSEFFFDKFLEYFFTDADAAFFSSLGLNCIRLPFNYRHFEDDMNPRVLKPEGFKHLDRVIDICAKHGIYTILDLHTAPGGQNTDWHADAGTHIAKFWEHKDFQDRVVWLWEELAQHYRANTWIAGYNPLNEPTDPYQTRLIAFYDRVYAAIRKHDPDHALFLDGNTFASDFSHFGDAETRWKNTAYAIHDYSVFGFPAAPEAYVGSEAQQRRLRRSYEKKREWMDQRGLCVWNGEWGPVYARKEYEGVATDAINEERYKVLKDQLEIYNKDRLSWSIWLYKDIGFQGMVHVSRDTPYMTLFKDFLAKKHRLAIDAWGADDTAVREIYNPLIDLIKREIKPEHQDLYPAPVWKLSDRIGRLSRNILVSEFLVREWAEHFRGKSTEELDIIAKSFAYENCLHRDGLNKVLTDNASLVAQSA